MAEIRNINGYALKDEKARNLIEELSNNIPSTATNILITDTANYFTSRNVEGALAELMLRITTIENNSNGTPITPTTYSITNNLSNCTTNNSSSSVSANSSYSATITANSGYTLDTVTVTMGGINITSSAVSGNNINITSVTGNIVITASAIEETNTGTTGTHVTEGLSLYLDSANPSNTTTTLADMSGNGNNFTSAVNITTNSANRVVLNGSQYFSNTSYQPHTTTDNDFTFEFFGDIESTGGRNYFFSYGSRNGFSWDEQQGLSGQMGAGDVIWPGTDTVSGRVNRIAPTFGEKHVIITKNGTTYSIYVDGALVADQTYTTSWSDSSYTNFRLFVRYNGSNQLRGAMRYVRWYTKGFTADEVAQNYNSRNNLQQKINL